MSSKSAQRARNNAKSNRRAANILSSFALAVYLISAIYGISQIFNEDTIASGILIFAMGLLGSAVCLLPYIVRRIWNVEIPLFILVFLYCHIFLAVVPGEIFNFYYTVWWWDKFLHFVAGLGICYIFFKILSHFLADVKNKSKIGFILAMSFFASLGTAVIWEISEFTVDSIFNTNMQKFIPAEFMPDNKGAALSLQDTDEKIAAFYREPSGYRYALMDTMYDHIAHTAGALLWVIIYKVGRFSSGNPIAKKTKTAAS